jgi:NAD(P)-dependent dehydrogenase (short-subunit alcohol dehydrogenase family)
MNLKSKTVMVVGAAGRLGRVIVEAILNEGAHVVAVDYDAKQLTALQDAYGSSENFLALSGDITKVLSIQAAIEQTVGHFGALDGAVNTAYPRNKNYGRTFLDVCYEDFSENVALHLGGYFLFMQQCVNYALIHKTKFSLVNLSSIYGSMAPRFELYQDLPMTMPVEYAAIKSAIEHLVRYVTAYTKGSKFRVNCLSPGGILDGQDDLFLQGYNRFCRDKGMLEPKDLTGTIMFMLSDASEYLCGQNIIVDDGFHS